MNYIKITLHDRKESKREYRTCTCFITDPSGFCRSHINSSFFAFNSSTTTFFSASSIIIGNLLSISQKRCLWSFIFSRYSLFLASIISNSSCTASASHLNFKFSEYRALTWASRFSQWYFVTSMASSCRCISLSVVFVSNRTELISFSSSWHFACKILQCSFKNFFWSV